jgi:hypothetical protein
VFDPLTKARNGSRPNFSAVLLLYRAQSEVFFGVERSRGAGRDQGRREKGERAQNGGEREDRRAREGSGSETQTVHT